MSEEEVVALLLDDGSEESSSDVDTSNACQHRPQRSLPPGKEYHLFISYSSLDREYVLGLKNVLEGLGFRCMLAEHDFSYGVSVMQNIEISIQTCCKQLLVVSKHFLISIMCDKEVDMAHKYAANIGRKDYMIVLRLDESKLPLKLACLTNINGAGLEVKYVGNQVERVLDVEFPKKQNGTEVLRKKPTAKSGGWLGCSRSEFRNLTQVQKNELISFSMKTSEACYRKLTEEANNHFFIKRYVFVTCGWIITLSFMFMLNVILYAVFNFRDIFAISAYVTIFITVISTSFAALCSSLSMKKLESIAWRNMDCKSQNYIVIPRSSYGFICISFIYYDMKPCWEFLEQKARELWPCDSDEDIANKCNQGMITTVFELFKGLKRNPVPPAARIRHKTYQDRYCLCQVTESYWTFAKKDSTGRSEQIVRDNRNEETCVMEITDSDMVHETSVKKIETEYFESTAGNNQTSVQKLPNRQEGVSGRSLSLTGAEGGTSVTETASTSLFDSNIDRCYEDMCETRLRGESTSTKQSQVPYEQVTLADYTMTKNDLKMSTSYNVPELAVTPLTGDEEMGYDRVEYSIDEETHAKVSK